MVGSQAVDSLNSHLADDLFGLEVVIGFSGSLWVTNTFVKVKLSFHLFVEIFDPFVPSRGEALN